MTLILIYLKSINVYMINNYLWRTFDKFCMNSKIFKYNIYFHENIMIEAEI